MHLHAATLALGIAIGVTTSWRIAEDLHKPIPTGRSYSSQDRRDLTSVVRAIQREARKNPQFRKPR